jgi:serine/threonine protein kinase
VIQPENLLLASKQSDVNIKLADFGFAKHTSQRLDTVCGTPDYIAPEVCALLDLKKVPRSQRPPYNELCDIWSAGVVRLERVWLDKKELNLAHFYAFAL